MYIDHHSSQKSYDEKMRWILASHSPRRKEILENIGLSFKIKTNSREEISSKIIPEKICEDIACIKSEGIITKVDEIAISADTVVVLDEELLGKPEDIDQAEEYLRRLSGRSHQVMTGLALRTSDKLISSYASTKVFFRELQDKDIEFYLKSYEWADKAGGYGIQGNAGLFVERIEGCYFNVVGFPLSLFYTLTEKSGIELFKEIGS